MQSWFRDGPRSERDTSRNGSVPRDTLHQLQVTSWQTGSIFSVAQKPAGTPELVQSSLVWAHQHLPQRLCFWKQHFPSKRKSSTSHPAATSPALPGSCSVFWRQGESNTCSSHTWTHLRAFPCIWTRLNKSLPGTLTPLGNANTLVQTTLALWRPNLVLMFSDAAFYKVTPSRAKEFFIISVKTLSFEKCSWLSSSFVCCFFPSPSH